MKLTNLSLTPKAGPAKAAATWRDILWMTALILVGWAIMGLTA